MRQTAFAAAPSTGRGGGNQCLPSAGHAAGAPFAPLRGNRASVPDRAGKVRPPASRVPRVLGLVPVAVSGTEEVNMPLLTLVTVSMAE